MSPASIEFRRLTQAELINETRRRFGDLEARWAFRCPRCDDTATVADWRKALDENAKHRTAIHELFGRWCIGRVLGALDGPQKDWKGRGCDWTTSGLIGGPWQVELPATEGESSPVLAPSFPLADGDDPATAVHLYRPETFGPLQVEDTRVVRVPDKHSTWGRPGPSVVERLLRIPDRCHCGAERGTPALVRRCHDGQWYDAHEWKNPCGHDDRYEDLLLAAGLSPA